MCVFDFPGCAALPRWRSDLESLILLRRLQNFCEIASTYTLSYGNRTYPFIFKSFLSISNHYTNLRTIFTPKKHEPPWAACYFISTYHYLWCHAHTDNISKLLLLRLNKLSDHPIHIYVYLDLLHHPLKKSWVDRVCCRAMHSWYSTETQPPQLQFHPPLALVLIADPVVLTILFHLYSYLHLFLHLRTHTVNISQL